MIKYTSPTYADLNSKIDASVENCEILLENVEDSASQKYEELDNILIELQTIQYNIILFREKFDNL